MTGEPKLVVDCRGALLENALWVPLVFPSSITAHSDKFEGFVPSLIGKPDFLGMYQT